MFHRNGVGWEIKIFHNSEIKRCFILQRKVSQSKLNFKRTSSITTEFPHEEIYLIDNLLFRSYEYFSVARKTNFVWLFREIFCILCLRKVRINFLDFTKIEIFQCFSDECGVLLCLSALVSCHSWMKNRSHEKFLAIFHK